MNKETNNNPYQTPESELAGPGFYQDAKLEKIVKGQKIVIYAILIHFLAIALQFVVGPAAAIISLLSIGLSLVGLAKMLSGMDSHILIKVLLFVLMFLPLINLLVLVSINARATKKLRAAGFRVGLLGASKP